VGTHVKITRDQIRNYYVTIMNEFNCNSVGLFASPVTKIRDIVGYEKVVDVWKEKLLDKVDFNQTSHSGYPLHIAREGLTNYYNHGSILDKFEELSELKQNLTDAANHVWQEVLNYDSELIIVQSWLNESRTGAEQPFHNHGNSVFCGTLYVNIDTALVFERQQLDAPGPILMMKPNLNRPNSYGETYHYSHVSIPVETGSCLFWPSQLRHGYMNQKEELRLSLSFNMMPSRIDDFYTFNVESVFTGTA